MNGKTVLASFLGLCFSWGCGGPKYPPTYPVNGKLTLDGVPVAGAEIVFAPKDKTGRPARGRSDANGKFSLNTYFGPAADSVGAIAGEYTVTATKIDLPPGGANPYKQKMPGNQLPPRYSDPGKSPANATVVATGPNEPEINLTR